MGSSRNGHLLHKYFGGLVLGSFVLATAAFAQTSTIEGMVRGPDGKPMKSADVRLEPKVKGVAAQTVKSDASGRYRFTNLNVAKYRVTVLSGSQTLGFIDNVNTTSSKTARVDFDIKGGAAGQPKKAKHLVWVPAETGSNLGGRWVEENDSSAGTQRVEKKNGTAMRNIQNNATSANNGAGGQ
jgi:hypothetical protein